MCDRKVVCLFASLGLLFFGGIVGQGQQAPEMIVFNAKIVTVDDKSFTSQVGTIAEAMAVKDGRIVEVGNEAQVRASAGPGTKMIDLKGRTVLPGLIDVHDHPYDWAPTTPYIIKRVLSDDIVVTRYLEGSPKEQVEAFPQALEEAVSKVKPDQWIYIVFSLGKKYEYGIALGMARISSRAAERVLDGKQITKELLDRMAPNHPVLLRDTFTGMIVNERALEEIDKVFHQEGANLIDRHTGQGGRDGGANFRSVFHDVTMQDHYQELKEIHRLELSWWTGYGLTTFASLAYTPSNIKVYNDLARSGEIPVRNMWGWNWREDILFEDQYLLNATVFMQGLGNDFFWYGGAQGSEENGKNCSTLRPRVDLPPSKLVCGLDPGTGAYKRLYEFIKSGGRMVIAHTIGDRDIDNLLNVIETASQEAGFTREQVREKRHGFDHLALSPRPDQIGRLKALGMVVGGNSFYFLEMAPSLLEVYGEEVLEWSNPKKSLVDAQIPSGFEVDRPLAGTDLTMFWTLARSIDRKAWDGKVYAPSQKISRELALKTITVWGAYYLMKEDVLGSLEPGKWADFTVLDRDYLTVPEEQIEDIRVLMTVVAGKVVHVVPSVAREIGMQPKGAQIELGGEAAQW